MPGGRVQMGVTCGSKVAGTVRPLNRKTKVSCFADVKRKNIDRQHLLLTEGGYVTVCLNFNKTITKVLSRFM